MDTTVYLCPFNRVRGENVCKTCSLFVVTDIFPEVEYGCSFNLVAKSLASIAETLKDIRKES